MEGTSTFAERLVYIMALRQVSKSDLAKLCSIDKSNITRYCSGKYKAKQDVVYCMASKLNVNPVWLMGYDVPMELHDSEKIPATTGDGLEERIDLSQLSEDQIVSIQKLKKLNPHYQALARNLIESLVSSQQAGDTQ